MAPAGTTSASDDHLNELAISIHSSFGRLTPPSDCCIFTVPERLRRTNEEAYTPHVVAIGPYHRLNPSLMPMEDHKLLNLRNFLRQYPNYCLKDYIKSVKSWEYEVRNYYDKKINLDSDQFTKMILLDGIFVIQLLQMRSGPGSMPPSDPIFSNTRMFTDICKDMALLENQIPFFVILRLFEMAFETHQQNMPKLLELVCRFFEPVMRKEKLPERAMETVKHFVDVISLSFIPPVTNLPNERHVEVQYPPSATELVAAGVKLRKCESKCLFNIEFKNGVLNIPNLLLEDSTELYFRNIIAFEQYHIAKSYLTHYLVFMDGLVNTPGDAELLINKGIIKNRLSNKEDATWLIKNLGKGILLLRGNYFNSLSHTLTDYCQSPKTKWKKTFNYWKETFKRDYCSTTWVVISVIAAVLLLLLTVVQAVCSVLSLKNLPS